MPAEGHFSSIAYANRDEMDESGFVFDSNGNPTTYNGTLATWNDENKMTAFGSALTAAYRPDGMRAYKSNGTTTTYFIYDQNGAPVQEIVGGSVSAVNTFGPNGLISRNGSSDVFYQFDERGDTVDRTNSSGTVLDYHGSDPYGQQYSSAAVADPYQGFGAQWGYYYDSETGYSLLGERYYDPAAGRFLNQDPIGFEGGINKYSYGGNSPIGFIDPTGDVQIEVISYRLPLTPGWHRGILVIDDVGKGGAYSFAGGPQYYGLSGNGNLISRSGPWRPGTQDYREMHAKWREAGDKRAVLLLDDDKASYCDWVRRFQRLEGFIAAQPPVGYAPLPNVFSVSSGTANSNTWSHWLIRTAGLESLYDHAIQKASGQDLPWAPGWDISAPYVEDY